MDYLIYNPYTKLDYLIYNPFTKNLKWIIYQTRNGLFIRYTSCLGNYYVPFLYFSRHLTLLLLRDSKMAAANSGRTERINSVNDALRMTDSLRSVIADQDTEQVNK